MSDLDVLAFAYSKDATVHVEYAERVKRVVVFVLLGLLGCSKPTAKPTMLDAARPSLRKESPVAQNDDKRAIFPFEGNEDNVPSGRGPYSPTVDDLAAFDAALPKALENATFNHTTKVPLAQRAPDYKRQYIGYVDSKGEHWVHGSFHCHVWPQPDFYKGYILVNDGEDCFFQIEFNVDTHETACLRVNGDA